MKIVFDKVSEQYWYPISSTDLRKLLLEYVPSEILSKLSNVRFGCNNNTTQEARIIERGSTFDIRINFCLKNGKTKLLTEKRDWCNVVEHFGGCIDKQGQFVLWSHEAARKYAVFLVMHEIAHIVYAQRQGFMTFSDFKSSPSEESWCDSFAKHAVS